MASSDLAPADAAWIVAPFQGPLDVLFDRVVAIEAGWEAQGNLREPTGEVHPDYLAALAEARRAMERAMVASWTPPQWHEYRQDAPADLPIQATLADEVAQAEFALVQTWNAQVVHACSLQQQALRRAFPLSSSPAAAGLF